MFLMETHVEFQPSYRSALSEAAHIWPGMLWQLERPIPLWRYVTDALTGEPLEAGISSENVTFLHAETSSSDGLFGRYHALLPAGLYDVMFAVDGYDPLTIAGVVVTAHSGTRLDAGREVALGSYFYRLEADGVSHSRRVLVVR